MRAWLADCWPIPVLVAICLGLLAVIPLANAHSERLRRVRIERGLEQVQAIRRYPTASPAVDTERLRAVLEYVAVGR